MKKSLSASAGGILILIFVSLPWPAFAQSVCHDITLETISRHLAMPGTAKIIQKHDRGSVCEVILRTRDSLAPLYVAQDFVLIGQLFQDRQPITQKTVEALKHTAQKEQEEISRQKAIQEKYRKDFLRSRISQLEKCVCITLRPEGKIMDQVYIITDPGCSHCKNALKELRKLSVESGIMVNLIIAPILGDQSRSMAAHAVCKKFSYEEYLEMKMPLKLPLACKAGKEYIKNTLAFLEKADINSVPMIIGNKASWIVTTKPDK